MTVRTAPIKRNGMPIAKGLSGAFPASSPASTGASVTLLPTESQQVDRVVAHHHPSPRLASLMASASLAGQLLDTCVDVGVLGSMVAPRPAFSPLCGGSVGLRRIRTANGVVNESPKVRRGRASDPPIRATIASRSRNCARGAESVPPAVAPRARGSRPRRGAIALPKVTGVAPRACGPPRAPVPPRSASPSARGPATPPSLAVDGERGAPRSSTPRGSSRRCRPARSPAARGDGRRRSWRRARGSSRADARPRQRRSRARAARTPQRSRFSHHQSSSLRSVRDTAHVRGARAATAAGRSGSCCSW